MKNSTALGFLLAMATAASSLTGCASMGQLSTPSGRPEITLPKAYLKHANVAITSYNLNKGRELDRAGANQIVTYEAVKGPDGNPQVSQKIVYDLVPKQDSIIIRSHRLITEDLDDDNATEDVAQPSFEAQQLELKQIETRVLQDAALDAVEPPSVSNASQDHTQ